MWAYFELLRLYSNVWVEPINSMLVVKGFTFVGESLASTQTCADTKFHVQWYYGY